MIWTQEPSRRQCWVYKWMQFWVRRWGLQWNLTCHHQVFKVQRVGENRFRPSQWIQGTTKRASTFWIILWELWRLTFEPGSTNHESHQDTVSEYHLRPWVEPRSLQEGNVICFQQMQFAWYCMVIVCWSCTMFYLDAGHSGFLMFSGLKTIIMLALLVWIGQFSTLPHGNSQI